MAGRIRSHSSRDILTIKRLSPEYKFLGNKKTGITFRWGKTINDDPYCAPWPELVDISISNHCTKGCDFCYINSRPDNSFMSLEDYEYILKSLKHSRWGNVFQVAIGGGEPLEHPNFLEIIDKTVEYGVVPNFTTNAVHLNSLIAKKIKNKIGAVAVSITNLYDLNDISFKCFLEYNIKTNIHFVLNADTLPQALEILEGKHNKILNNFNSIIFLTYKSIGRADKSKNLSYNKSLKRFVNLIDNNKSSIGVGFDACFVPLLLHLTKTNVKLIDPCECGFFSVYVDENLNVKPCSFSPDNDKHIYNLKKYTFEDIWTKKFKKYRNSINNNCQRDCSNKHNCRGGCPYYDNINFCYSDKKSKSL
jgi:radical SAM protein with 4Fe4S-binding SPASM domain